MRIKKVVTYFTHSSTSLKNTILQNAVRNFQYKKFTTNVYIVPTYNKIFTIDYIFGQKYKKMFLT